LPFLVVVAFVVVVNSFFAIVVVRVERAIDNDTTRLENECFAYQDAVRQDLQRTRGLQQATSALFVNNVNTTTNTATSSSSAVAQQAFRDEIMALEEACRLSQMELDRLDELMREQLLLKQELDVAILEAAEERNLLVWDAKNFDEDQVQLTRELMLMQSVEQRLLSFQLTGTSISLKVDKDRGLRYPLINGLRLAYRPKGDLDWNEVQSAWALAGQLLYIIGNVFAVTGQQWKIVPLSDCAKLFYFPKLKPDGTQSPSVVFNLGHPATNGSKALLTWNAALSQTIVRARSVLAETPGSTLVGGRALPYEMTPTTIGRLVLPKLDRNDDSDWARTIHYMASNLLWLSENADSYLQEKVGTMALVLSHGATNECFVE
jgi:Apg6 BARA domain